VKRTQEHLIDALDRVEQDLASNPDLASAITPEARENFSVSRRRLTEYMKSQDTLVRTTIASVQTKATLRNTLIEDHIRPICIIARRKLRHVRELAGFTAPRARARYGSIVAAGYGIAESARQFEQVFRAAGLPAGFIDQLVGATDALKNALITKGEANSRKMEATAGMTEESRVARDTLQVLDVLVRRTIKDPVQRARWASVSRVASAAFPQTSDQTTGNDGSTGTITPVPAADRVIAA
jgi:hypothetical protein